MGFKDAVQTCLSKYVDFNGRARRSEYWYFVLFYSIVMSALSLIGNIIGGDSVATTLAGIASVALLLPNLGVAIRRLHDIGKSGWSLLFGLIPIIGEILLIVWYCKDSQPGENKYGPNPKQAGVF